MGGKRLAFVNVFGPRRRSARRSYAFRLRAHETIAESGFEFAQILADQSEIEIEPFGVFHAVFSHFGHYGVFHVSFHY